LIARIAETACRQDWISKAPLLIVLCTVGVGDDRGGCDIRKQRFPEYAQAIGKMDQDLCRALIQEEHRTKIAGTHMALVALECGVGSSWVSRFGVKRPAKLLKLPGGCMPSEILALGYPGEDRKLTGKKKSGEVVFHNTLDDGVRPAENRAVRLGER
jgi:nitroreductase